MSTYGLYPSRINLANKEVGIMITISKIKRNGIKIGPKNITSKISRNDHLFVASKSVYFDIGQ